MDKNPLKQFQCFQWLRATLIIYICFFCRYLVVASVVLSLVIALCHMDLSTHSLHICSSCFRVICGTHIFIYWRSWFSVPTSTHLGVCMSCAKHCEFLRNKRPSIFQMLIFRYIWYVAICCSTLNHCDCFQNRRKVEQRSNFKHLTKSWAVIIHLTISSQHFPPMLKNKQTKAKYTSSICLTCMWFCSKKMVPKRKNLQLWCGSHFFQQKVDSKNQLNSTASTPGLDSCGGLVSLGSGQIVTLGKACHAGNVTDIGRQCPSDFWWEDFYWETYTLPETKPATPENGCLEYDSFSFGFRPTFSCYVTC